MPKTSRRDFLRWTLAGSGLLLAGAASVLEPAPARAVTRLGAPTQQSNPESLISFRVSFAEWRLCRFVLPPQRRLLCGQRRPVTILPPPSLAAGDRPGQLFAFSHRSIAR